MLRVTTFRLKPALDWARAGPECVEGPEATRQNTRHTSKQAPHVKTGATRQKRHYDRRVNNPVPTSASAQTKSMFTHAVRRMPTPNFSNTSTAITAVTST